MDRTKTRKGPSHGLPLLLLGAAVFLYLKLFVPPFTPFGISGDQIYFLTNAMRILRGEVIYRDFFQFTPPGTDLVYLSMFKTFGMRAWIPNIVIMTLGIGLTWVITILSKKIISGRLAYLPGILFFTLVYEGAFTGTHHWFSTLAVMAGVAVIIEKRTRRRLAATGALFGWASFFTQTRGVMGLVGVILFLWWEHSSEQRDRIPFSKAALSLCLPFIFTIMALSSYFIWKAGLARVYSCQVAFVFRHLPGYADYLRNLPPVPPWHNLVKSGVFLSVHALLPLVYLLFLVEYLRTRRKLAEPWDRSVLLSIVGCCLFAGVAPGPNFVRLYGVFAPALIILIWLIRGPRGFSRALRGVLWVGASVMIVASPWFAQHRRRVYLDLPTGRTAFTNFKLYDKLHWLDQHTRPSEYVFEASVPEVYFPLLLRDPAPVDDFPFLLRNHAQSQSVSPSDNTSLGDVQDIIDAIERRRPRYILWSPVLDVLVSQQDHHEQFRVYIDSHYHIIKTLSGREQVWERNP